MVEGPGCVRGVDGLKAPVLVIGGGGSVEDRRHFVRSEMTGWA